MIDEMEKLKEKLIEDDKKKLDFFLGEAEKGLPPIYAKSKPIGILKLDTNEEYAVGISEYIYSLKENKGYSVGSKIVCKSDKYEYIVYNREA